MDSVLIPVPLHWRRYFWREYNQSEFLVRELVKLPIRAQTLNLLRRTRFTRPQVELHATERCRNIQYAFRVNTSIKIPLNTRLIVFDDILTTGSTINECCRTLQAYGFSNIYAATFAQTYEEGKTV
jgi:predicted amidophosphoribosyltransferase